ncbi:hypothetical protein E2562_010511 [Oryza meyeriana var. granulata]|uniref:DUF4219 domain-containing protein n=1 Tax=Oryza meyeriana var. granulata TaxID=110450 RepID=A0A6G1DVV8_9ORYZ|nr:hypothetical protein E2562_010511 [Oryza meyeriana var. granulata]
MATSEKFDTRAPFFDGTDYDYWKSRMTNYLKGKSLKLWKITKNDTYVIPAQDPTEAAEIELLETNHRAVAILQSSICKSEYDRVSSEELAYKIWDKLKKYHEGSNTVKNQKFEIYRKEFDAFCQLPDEELEVLDDDQLVLLSNKFKRVYENRRNRRRADGCFNCEGSSDSSDSDAEDEAPKKKTDGLCFIADADVDGGICTMALEDDAATDNNNNDKSSDDEPKLVTHSLPEMQVTCVPRGEVELWPDFCKWNC